MKRCAKCNSQRIEQNQIIEGEVKYLVTHCKKCHFINKKPCKIKNPFL